MDEYRVNLDIYNGPLDLLLYLIRREEVDIYDIPIARITEQYVQYVDLIHNLDPDLAGEFLVMAATLMEIKTRMMLPSVEGEQAEEEPLQIDPRTELIRQLLEYKAFKDAAGDLRQAEELQSLKFPRGPQARYMGHGDPGQAAEPADGKEFDLEEVQVWDLFDAFSSVLKAIGAEPGYHHIIRDDTPLELHAAEIMHLLESEGPTTFDRLFEGRSERMEMIGLFLALLELIRRRRVLAGQDANFGHIRLHANPNPPDDAEQAPAAGEQDGSDRQERQLELSPAGPPADDAATMSVPLVAQQEGAYVPEKDSAENGNARTDDQAIGD